MFLSTGLEHNVFGKPAEGVGDRVMEMEKRHRKLRRTGGDHPILRQP